MPSSLTHSAIPIALAIAVGRNRIGWPLLAASVVASVLPDIDFAGVWLRVPYQSEFAHRGIVHSLCFAVLVAAVAALYAGRLRATPGLVFAFVLIAGASHGLLDMLTHGGRGVLYLWPFSGERLFLPWQPLSSMPASIGNIFQTSGAATLRAEARWVWLPCLALAFAVRLGRRA